LNLCHAISQSQQKVKFIVSMHRCDRIDINCLTNHISQFNESCLTGGET
jgi:hypothetical protein